MDTATVDKKGITPLQPAFDRIAGVNDAPSSPLCSPLENDGTPDGFFNFGVNQDKKDSTKQIAEIYQGGLSLPDRDYYLKDSPHFVTIRKQYIEHMKKHVHLGRRHAQQAAKEAAAVMEIETAMAKASMAAPRCAIRRTYHIYTVVDFKKLTPAFDWSIYFNDSGIGFRHAECRDARLLQGSQRPHPERAARLMEELPPLAGAARPGIQPVQAFLR
jgi:putative endopeptidase